MRPSVQLFNDGFDDFATFPNTGDVGIVILDQPIVLAEYGELSEAGILDSLAAGRGRNSVLLTVTGMGSARATPSTSRATANG